jgi:hypothetical protein
MTKKIENFINKFFKMSDGYLQDYQKLPIGQQGEKLTRGMINQTFESFRKKKEAAAAAAGGGGTSR